jgi:hypothetical protein
MGSVKKHKDVRTMFDGECSGSTIVPAKPAGCVVIPLIQIYLNEESGSSTKFSPGTVLKFIIIVFVVHVIFTLYQPNHKKTANTYMIIFLSVVLTDTKRGGYQENRTSKVSA